MDAAFTVGRYSVQRDDENRPAAAITLSDQNDRWRARVEFVAEPPDTERPSVEMWDECCGRVLMRSDYLESFIDMLRSGEPVYVSFSTEADLFIVTGKEPLDEAA